MALSSVIRKTILSIYPPLNGKEDAAYTYLHTVIVPREIDVFSDEEIKSCGLMTRNFPNLDESGLQIILS